MLKDTIVRWTGALALGLLTAGAAGQLLLAEAGGATPATAAGGDRLAADPDPGVGPRRQWLLLAAASEPPRLLGGQRYALAFEPRTGPVGRARMQLRWPRRWRFALSQDVPLRLRMGQEPAALRRVPAAAPWRVAYEADMRAGAYAVELGATGTPTLDFLAEPLERPGGPARE